MDCSVFICAEKCHFHWIDKCFCDMIHIGAIYDTNGEEKFMLISGKIITGILTAAVMAAGNGTPTPDTGALLQKANGTMLQVESMSVMTERQMDVAFDGEITSTIIQSDIDTIAKPFKANVDVVVIRNGEVAQRYGTYAVESGEGIDTYLEMEGKWVHEAGTIADISQYDIWTQKDLFLNYLSSFVVDGAEEINGIQTTKISGVLTGEAMEKVLETSGIDLVFGGLGWSLDELDTELEAMEELPVSLWISPDGYLICYEFDITDRMQAALDNLSGTEENFQTIVKTKLRGTCSNFNEISDFEIPKEITSGAVEFEEFWQEMM